MRDMFLKLLQKRFLLFLLVSIFLASNNIFAKEAGVYDFAGFLKDSNAKEISDELKNIYNQYGKSAVVYITSKNLKSIASNELKSFIIGKAKQYGVKGLFVFISLNPKLIKILASKDVKGIFSTSYRKDLEQKIVSYFKKKDLKGGIMVIVSALKEQLSVAKRSGNLSSSGMVASATKGVAKRVKEKEKSSSLIGKIIFWVVIIFIILFIVQFIRGLLQARRANMYPQQGVGGGTANQVGGGSHHYGGGYDAYGGYRRSSGFKNLMWGLLGGAVGSYLGHKLYDSFSSAELADCLRAFKFLDLGLTTKPA